MDDGKGDVPTRRRRRSTIHDYEDLLAAAAAGRVPRRRREPRRVDVLHERHDRQPEGRRVLAPLDVPAHDGRDDGRIGSALRESDVILPVVPMFHANAWGLAHAAVACRRDARDARPRPLAARRSPTSS